MLNWALLLLVLMSKDSTFFSYVFSIDLACSEFAVATVLFVFFW